MGTQKVCLLPPFWFSLTSRLPYENNEWLPYELFPLWVYIFFYPTRFFLITFLFIITGTSFAFEERRKYGRWLKWQKQVFNYACWNTISIRSWRCVLIIVSLTTYEEIWERCCILFHALLEKFSSFNCKILLSFSLKRSTPNEINARSFFSKMGKYLITSVFMTSYLSHPDRVPFSSRTCEPSSQEILHLAGNF